MKNRLNDSIFGIIVLILTLILWNYAVDFLFYHCKEWPTGIKVIISFFIPFIILTGIWNLTEYIENIVYGRDKGKDDI